MSYISGFSFGMGGFPDDPLEFPLPEEAFPLCDWDRVDEDMFFVWMVYGAHCILGGLGRLRSHNLLEARESATKSRTTSTVSESNIPGSKVKY